MTVESNVVLVFQVISAIVIGWIFWGYFKLYSKEYLRFWAASFWALGTYLAAMVMASHLRASYNLPATHYSIFFLSLIYGGAGYLQIILLFLGTRSLVSPHRSVIFSNTQVILLSLMLGFLVTLPYAFSDDGALYRYMLRNGLRYFLGGCSFLVAALVIYRYTYFRSLGRALAIIVFVLYGTEMSLLGGLVIDYSINQSNSFLFAVVRYHGLFELLVYPLIALALVIWLLEIERARGVRNIHKLANINKIDFLTGLANRDALLETLQQVKHIRAENECYFLVLFGVDNFNRFNTSEGIKKGDELLVVLARRLLLCTANADFSGRLNSDVFVCLFDAKQNAIFQLAETLRKSLSRRVQLSNDKYYVEMSVGITKVSANHNDEELLFQANSALQKAKSQGGRQTVQWTDAMVVSKQVSLSYENEIRDALIKKQLRLHYQPIWSEQQQKVVSVEALVRWQHPIEGLLAPFKFLPAMVQLGLMNELDLWVMDTACSHLRAWQKENTMVNVSVNLSVESLYSENIVELLEQRLNHHRILREYLVLEITENSAMQSIEAGRNTLQRIKDLGVKIAIDDFGSGYSSLNYLRSLPSDIIKFDRSFVEGLSSENSNYEILKVMLPLCHKLKKQCVIEGVETEQQKSLLQELNFNLMQGYFFSKPVPYEETSSFLQRNFSFVSS